MFWQADQHAATIEKAKLRARSKASLLGRCGTSAVGLDIDMPAHWSVKAARINDKAAKRLEQERLAAEAHMFFRRFHMCVLVLMMLVSLGCVHGHSQLQLEGTPGDPEGCSLRGGCRSHEGA